MNAFWKILLLVVVAIVAIKLLPVTLVLGAAVGGVLALCAALGVSVVVLLVGSVLLLAAVLSPIWLPILALVGVVALIRRSSRPPAEPCR